MKIKFLIMALMISFSLPVSGMQWDYDDDDDQEDAELEINAEELKNFVPHIVKVWALPEEENEVHAGFAYNSTTSIHAVVEHGNYQHLVNRLQNISTHAVNQRDQRGNTPLHIAARLLSYKKVDLLLQHEANPQILNDDEEDAIDSMPEVHIDPNQPLTSLMQPQYVIGAIIELKLKNRPYEIVDCSDGRLRF